MIETHITTGTEVLEWLNCRWKYRLVAKPHLMEIVLPCVMVGEVGSRKKVEKMQALVFWFRLIIGTYAVNSWTCSSLKKYHSVRPHERLPRKCWKLVFLASEWLWVCCKIYPELFQLLEGPSCRKSQSTGRKKGLMWRTRTHRQHFFDPTGSNKITISDQIEKNWRKSPSTVRKNGLMWKHTHTVSAFSIQLGRVRYDYKISIGSKKTFFQIRSGMIL